MFSLHQREKRGSLSIAAAVLFLLLPIWVTASGQSASSTESHYAQLPNFHRVGDKLYRGGQPRSGGIQDLVALGVNTIINLRDDDERAEAESREAQAAGLRYFNIPLARWGRPQDADVDRVLALIDNAENGVVFIHCAHGADRTGVVIAVYRIRHDGWTSERAKQEAHRHGMKFWQHRMKDYIHDTYRDRP